MREIYIFAASRWRLKRLVAFFLGMLESPFSIKRGSRLLQPKPTLSKKERYVQIEPLQERRFQDFIRERFDPANESMATYHNARCFSLPCKHARLGIDKDARDIVVLSRGYRLIQQGRPGIALRSAFNLLKDRLSGDQRKISLDSALIAGCYYSDSANYYHFWCDAIIDTWLFYQISDERQPDFIIMPFANMPWQKEILEISRLPFERVIGLHKFAECTIGRANIIFRAKGGRCSPPWLHKALQEVARPWLYEEAGYPQKIYCTRQATSRRRLSNEAEVIQIMIEHGYTIIDCANETVSNQIRLFRNATHIVAPHGAALTNIAWCKPNTNVLDLMPCTHMNPCFFDLAAQGELNYSIFPTNPLNQAQDPLSCPVKISSNDFKKYFEKSTFASSTP